MTRAFTLEAVDQPFFREDEESDDIRLHLQARFADGTSHVSELIYPSPEEIREVIWDFDSGDMGRRLDQISALDQKTYREWLDDVGDCRCGYVCSGPPCTYDFSDQREWLIERTSGGVLVTWWWQPFGFSGSQIIEEHDIGYDESGDQLHWRIDISSFLHDIGLPVDGY